MQRSGNRTNDSLRDIEVKRHFTGAAPGSIWIRAGRTTLLCTASISADVPPWLEGKDKGWLTAEYAMLPGSTDPRKRRDRGKVDGRSTEIQRLIGRSLRAVVDLEKLGPMMIHIDCDVLEADGGTRTLAITGAQIALIDAINTVRARASEGETVPPPAAEVLTGSIAAVSVGLVDGQPLLDLDYKEDYAADVDMNVVMTGSGRFIEVQASGEEATFSDDELAAMLALAKNGIGQLTSIQAESLGDDWPF